MNKRPARHRYPAARAGFTLIELAIGMAVVGLVLSGVLLIGGKLWDLERREENSAHLREAKAAILDFARKNGRFPMMDVAYADNAPVIAYTDGNEDLITGDNNCYYASGGIGYYPFGWVPYATLGSKARDSFGNQVQYFVNWQLAKEGGIRPCQALKNYLSGKITLSGSYVGYYGFQSRWTTPTLETFWYPRLSIVNTIPVAAVLISAAQNKTFDNSSAGDNKNAYKFPSTGFLMKPQTDTFDDQVEYITLPEAYAALNCQ